MKTGNQTKTFNCLIRGGGHTLHVTTVPGRRVLYGHVDEEDELEKTEWAQVDQSAGDAEPVRNELLHLEFKIKRSLNISLFIIICHMGA